MDSREIRNVILDNAIFVIQYKRNSSAIRTPLAEGLPQITKNKVGLRLLIARPKSSRRPLQDPRKTFTLNSSTHTKENLIHNNGIIFFFFSKHENFASFLINSHQKIQSMVPSIIKHGHKS